MIPVLLIVIPLVSGLLAFLIKQEKGVRVWALLTSIITMVVAILGIAVLHKP
jgi:NADH-quinone oxidoreductase subunit M